MLSCIGKQLMLRALKVTIARGNYYSSYYGHAQSTNIAYSFQRTQVKIGLKKFDTIQSSSRTFLKILKEFNFFSKIRFWSRLSFVILPRGLLLHQNYPPQAHFSRLIPEVIIELNFFSCCIFSESGWTIKTTANFETSKKANQYWPLCVETWYKVVRDMNLLLLPSFY